MGADQRVAERRLIKAKALVAVGEGGPVAAQTIDISLHGIGITMPHPVKPGQQAQIEFDLYHDGKSHPVRSLAKVTHCIFGGGAFRAGFEFSFVEPKAMVAITNFVRSIR